MGSAMLRGWLRGGAAGRFVVIEPAGAPGGLADSRATEWHRAPEDVPADLEPDAVVLAVKPQVLDALLPAYRRWVRPETLLLSNAAGKTIAGIARHLGGYAWIGNQMTRKAGLRSVMEILVPLIDGEPQ